MIGEQGVAQPGPKFVAQETRGTSCGNKCENVTTSRNIGILQETYK